MTHVFMVCPTKWPRSSLSSMKKIKPKPGQESVWDYPRPPRLEPVDQQLRVFFQDTLIANTTRGYRLLETSHPPVYYIPPRDIRMDYLFRQSGQTSICEYKGQAHYYDLRVGDRQSPRAAWAYEHPNKAYRAIAGYLAFYASRVDACFVGEEQVLAQEGDFYGGWVTSRIVGPFKGGPGTWGW